MGTTSKRSELEIWRRRALASEQKVAQWEPKLEDLQRRFDSLEKKSIQQEQRIAELESDLAKARKTSGNSSKPPSSDIVKPPNPAPKNADGKRTRGGQPGHLPHKRAEFAPDELDQIKHYRAESCPCCGGTVTEWDAPAEVIQQIEIPPRSVIITEHHRHSHWCAQCQTAVKPAWPEGLTEAGLIGPRLLALVGFLKGACGMSLGVMRRFFRDVIGVKLSKGYLAKLLNRISGCLADPVEELVRLLPDQPRVNVDETGHKDNGKRLWTWVFRTELFTLFRISPSRGSDVLLEMLGTEFNGLLGCDYFSAYRKYMRLNENVQVQFCLAHFIRDVKFLVTHPNAKNRNHGELLLGHLRKLFGIIHCRDQYATESGFRNALSRVRTDLVCAATFEPPETKEASALAERFCEHSDSYFRFLTEPDIDPTNNVAEQAFRFVAIQRRITQGTRGTAGQLWSQRIWTVVATCQQRGHSAFHYLTSAISAVYSHQPTPPLLLPQLNTS